MRGRAPQKDRIKVYQSHISKTPEGIRMQFTGDTQDSKFVDSGGWVFAETEQGEAIFYLENPDIRAAVDEIPQKKWVTVRGEGKGDGAWIIIEDASGPVLPEKPRQPASSGGHDANDGWEQLVGEVSNLTNLAVSALKGAGNPVDGSAIQGIWSTIFIALDRRS